MRALIQRVSRAEVAVEGGVIGKIGPGLVVFVCAMQGDGPKTADALAARISKLRIFPDDEGRMNRSLVDVGGAMLAISQFTLAGDTTRGNRPGFSTAAEPGVAEALYERFVEAVAELRISVKTGRFGAHMEVSLVNDGPVTIWMDTALRDPRS